MKGELVSNDNKSVMSIREILYKVYVQGDYILWI